MGLFDRLDERDQRVAFIGIDGVPYSLIADHPEIFEQLTEIIDGGYGTPVESVYPPESSACWPAITTGTDPGRTGVYGFQERSSESYETFVPMATHVAGKRIWDRVQSAGRRASVLNVPVTYPPDEHVDRMISGFLSPNVEKAANSTELARIAEELGYRIDVDARLGHQSDKSAFFEDATATLDGRTRVFEHIIAQDDWDLFFGVFMTTDRVNHFAFGDYENDGPNRTPFLDFYREVDEAIGRLYRSIPDDVTVVIASDHGFTTLEYDVDMNAWLREAGWLSYQDSDPASLEDIGGETRAYALAPGRFYLNLEGREPRGCVPAAEYVSVRSNLRSELLDASGPDGSSIFADVVPREQAFSEDPTGHAPDLVGIPARGFDLAAKFDDANDVFDSGPRNGMHTFENASLIVNEPVEIDGRPNICDIGHFILDRMGLTEKPAALAIQPVQKA